MHVKRRGHVLHHMPHVAGPLRRALAAIAKLQPAPECIVATGDLTEGGATAEYARLRELIERCPLPIYLIPGNHDRADALRSAFPGHRYLFQSPCGICYTIERERLRVIALDSSSECYSGGWLDRSRLDWLRRCLRERPSTRRFGESSAGTFTSRWRDRGAARSALPRRAPHRRRRCIRNARGSPGNLAAFCFTATNAVAMSRRRSCERPPIQYH